MSNKFKILGAVLISALFTSCLNDLETKPKVELTLENLLKNDPKAIEGIVSKIYGTFALSGPDGPGSSDITAPDAGEGAFLRSILNLQDFSADGMKNRWGDDGLDQLTTTSNWTNSNKFFRYLYDRAYYTIPQSTNVIIALQNSNVPNKESYIGEMRFLRALAYYYLIDCFGKGVIINEQNFNTAAPLPEASRAELFAYVESELKDVEQTITSEKRYGRANVHVVRMLLAKLYLNAEVYTGVSKYAEALTYSEKVINEGGYSLSPSFVSNFSADNDSSQEIIFPLIADALVSQSYGNTTYIVNGSLSTETMNPNDFGATGGWTGHRATKAWYGLFNGGDLLNSTDDRAKLFWTDKHNYEMNNYKTWTDGFPSIKFRNLSYSGSSVSTAFSSTDFPLYRLADAYLIYAEAHLRGGGGSLSTATGYVNLVRTRSNASTISSSELTLDFILDERARELNLEGHRRTDLIRFGKFTGGDYLWPWKGNVVSGASIPNHYNLYPIPLTALQANSNLKQNPGY